MSGQSTPAGWYPDPQNPGQQRYWDGTTWSDATQAAAGGAPAPAFGQQVGYGYAQGAGTMASFGNRLVAFIIDWAIVIIPGYILVAILAAIADVLGLVGYLALIGGWIYYFAYFEGGADGQTIGKKQMKIRVVDAATMQPGIGTGRAAGRAASKWLSSLICYLGFLWMLWDPEKQTWHDKIVTTKVVTA